jgi:serine/threonine protein phosphatase PrpC
MLQIHRGIAFSAARANPGGQPFSGSSMLELEFAQHSDPGKVREHNEDFVGHAEPRTPENARSHGWLFAVADGVGGQDRGEVASRTAVDTLITGFGKYPAGEPASSMLQKLVHSANLQIYETAAASGPGGSSMCTTLVACIVRYDRVTIAHVGDSRCYLVRRGRAHPLTSDHTVVGEQVRMGLLSKDEAAASGARHLLSRSLGSNLFVNVEIGEQPLLAGDVLLLSSDGFHGSVTDNEIATTVDRFHVLRDGAEALVSLANEKDGSDNISVQLVRIKAIERMGMYRGRPYKLR